MLPHLVNKKQLERTGFTFEAGENLRECLGISVSEWQDLLSHWNNLGPDNYLGTDYMFRLRRYGQFKLTPSIGELVTSPPVSFSQPAHLNSHAGGMTREFLPLEHSAETSPALHKILKESFNVFEVPEELRAETWIIDVNFFRIRTEGPSGYSPTPEGIHRDGYPFGVISVVNRHNIEGGVSHVYSLEDEFLAARVLGSESFDAIYAYDTRMKHYTTPIYSQDGGEGYRDLLGFVYYLPGTSYDKEQ